MVSTDSPAIFLPIFAVLWLAVVLTMGIIGGWRTLAKSYRATQPFRGQRWHFRSGSMPGVSYGACLTLGANAQGLYISVLFPFRIGHPPLFIRWSEIESTEPDFWFLAPMVKFHFRKAPPASFMISRKLALELAREAHGRFAIPGS